MSAKLNTLKDLYKNSYFEFDTDDKTNKISDLNRCWEIIGAVLDNRNQIGNRDIKIMADGRQRFVKICMSLFPENYSETDFDKKRNAYSRGCTAVWSFF